MELHAVFDAVHAKIRTESVVQFFMVYSNHERDVGQSFKVLIDRSESDVD